MNTLRELLTPREFEVARFIAEANRNDEIAVKMHVTTGCVKNHLAHIYEKLGLGQTKNGSRDCRVELALRYQQEECFRHIAIESESSYNRP